MTRPTLTYRSATIADVPAIAEIGYHSFPFAEMPIPAREQSLREGVVFPVENRLVGEAGGRVLTAMNCIPFVAWVAGAPQRLLGLGGVAVAPEARRYGLASEMVVEGMRRERERGATLSALYPFRHDFYASLGYALAVERLAWTVDPRDLPLYPERARVRRARPDDLERVMECYARVMRRSTLMVERDRPYWEERILAGGRSFLAVYEDARTEPRGYMVFAYREPESGPLMRFDAVELVAEGEEALRGLLGHLASLRDQFREVSLVLPPDERLDLRLANPRERGEIMGPISRLFGPRVLYGAMARVLDVAGALRARTGYGAEGRARLAISDAQVPENDGLFDVAFGGGAAEVAPAGAGGEGAGGRRAGGRRADGDVAAMSVGAFTQLYLGYASASELSRVGLLEAGPGTVALLDGAFAGPRPALLDYF